MLLYFDLSQYEEAMCVFDIKHVLHESMCLWTCSKAFWNSIEMARIVRKILHKPFQSRVQPIAMSSAPILCPVFKCQGQNFLLVVSSRFDDVSILTHHISWQDYHSTIIVSSSYSRYCNTKLSNLASWPYTEYCPNISLLQLYTYDSAQDVLAIMSTSIAGPETRRKDDMQLNCLSLCGNNELCYALRFVPVWVVDEEAGGKVAGRAILKIVFLSAETLSVLNFE